MSLMNVTVVCIKVVGFSSLNDKQTADINLDITLDMNRCGSQLENSVTQAIVQAENDAFL